MNVYLQYLIRSPLSYFAALFLLGTIIWFAKYTVASGEKHDKLSNTTYGYKIEKYFCFPSTELRVWTNRGFLSETSYVYQLSHLTVDKIEEESWLSNDTAVYLNLRLKYHDSIETISPARIIYDFTKEEIHTSSNLTLQGIGTQQKKNTVEFDALLLSLSN